MAIPFKSLRYRPGARPDLGHQPAARGALEERVVASRAGAARADHVPRHPRRCRRPRRSSACRCRQAGANLELKPYAIAGVSTDRTVDAGASTTISTARIGGDVKYGITQNLTADFTVNTDFAQVEVDEQQVNLTRFSLFFPEKRDFFLEGLGTFAFAGRAERRARAPAPATRRTCSSAAASASIDGARRFRFDAGGRITGKAGKFTDRRDQRADRRR